MGAFLKIFMTMLAMSVLLSIAFPGAETQFLSDNFFTLLLEEETNPLTNETEFVGFNNSNVNPTWSEGGNRESSFLQNFLDGLSIIKTFTITLINVAVLPITIAIRMQIPPIVRILFFIPLALLYIISAVMIIIRGVNP